MTTNSGNSAKSAPAQKNVKPTGKTIAQKKADNKILIIITTVLVALSSIAVIFLIIHSVKTGKDSQCFDKTDRPVKCGEDIEDQEVTDIEKSRNSVDLSDYSAFLRIESLMTIQDVGPAVSGSVGMGEFNTGEVVKILKNTGETIDVTIIRMDIDRQIVENAPSGSNVTIVLEGVTQSDLDYDWYLVKDNTGNSENIVNPDEAFVENPDDPNALDIAPTDEPTEEPLTTDIGLS